MTERHPTRPRTALLALTLAGAPLLAAAATPPPAAPDGAEPLSLQRAVSLAVAHHPLSRGAAARAAAAGAEVEVARAALRPTADLGAAATRYQEPMVVTPIHGFTPGDLPAFDETLAQGSLRVEQTLWDGGSRRAAVDARESAAGAAGAGAAESTQAVIALTVTTYLRALSLDRILAAHDLRDRALAAELERVRQAFTAGAVAQVEVQRVAAARAAARADRVATETARAVALGDLARATGLPAEAVTADALVGLALAVPEPPARDAVLARLDAESPALRRAREELAAAEAAVRLARAEDRPKLRGDAEWLEFGSSAGDFSGEWRAGLRVAVPLYRGGATAARVARAEAARDAAAAAEDAALLGLEEAIDRALAAAAEAAARAASLVEAEEALREVVRVERLRLAAGAGVEADYLEAEADLLAARARLAEARHAELVARAELARAAGALDEGWVERELVARPPEAGPREGEVP